MTKSDQRTRALSSRRMMSVSERGRLSRTICERLALLLAEKRGATVLSYLAEEDEVDLSSLEGFLTAYPVCGRGGQMEAYIPAADDPLKPALFGIRQPAPALGTYVNPADFDIVFVPCVAFDEDCHRLGHGGGYYDRYLKRCPDALVIAVAFEAQKLLSVSTEEHDIPMDIVVTEAGMYMT